MEAPETGKHEEVRKRQWHTLVCRGRTENWALLNSATLGTACLLGEPTTKGETQLPTSSRQGLYGLEVHSFANLTDIRS